MKGAYTRSAPQLYPSSQHTCSCSRGPFLIADVYAQDSSQEAPRQRRGSRLKARRKFSRLQFLRSPFGSVKKCDSKTSKMDPISKDEMFLAPTIFLTSPQVNNSLFAEVSTDSFHVVSTQMYDDFPLMDASQYIISQDLESDNVLYNAMYSNLRREQYELQSPLSNNYECNIQNYFIHEENDVDANFPNKRKDNLDDNNVEPLLVSEWNTNLPNLVNDMSQPLASKVNSFDSLDVLLNTIADSVIASNRPGGSFSTITPDKDLPEEPSTFRKKTNSHGSMEEITSGTQDNLIKTQQNETNFSTEKSNNSLSFFNDISFSECPKPISKEVSHRELLVVFDELNKNVQNPKSLSSCGSLIKSLEANYYIKSESGYHLPTKALPFLKGEDYSVHYNPYYTFLPEFTPNSKYKQTKNSVTLDAQLRHKKSKDPKRSQWIKSCEFHNKYPPDPLRFLSYIKSNNVGGDRRVLSETQYNPYYTFLPRFDKGALNETETQACVEEMNEVVQHITTYKQIGDTASITPYENIGDCASKEIKHALHEGVKLDKITESPEDQIISQKEAKMNQKENNNVKAGGRVIKKTPESVIKQCFSDLSSPIVTVIPPNAIRETSSGSNKHLVAVISHLFRDTMPEPIVHESPSSHSNHDLENRESDVNTVSHTLDDSNSTQPTLSDLEPFDTPALLETESSKWMDIGWTSLEKLIVDSDIDLEDPPAGNAYDLAETMWPSDDPNRCELSNEHSISSPKSARTFTESTLEPPTDFGARSNSLTMNSLYENPHRHNEISPELMSALSSNALTRYQYVGCPLCSSSSTVVDEQELMQLVAKSKPGICCNSAPTSRDFDLKQFPIKTDIDEHAPTKKTLTVAGQLLHPQVDAFLATRNQFSIGHNKENIDDAGKAEHILTPTPDGILTNVRLAAGGSIIMSPTVRHGNECMQCGRSFSAGRGDDQFTGSMKPCNRRVQIKKVERPAWSAPTFSQRRETGELRNEAKWCRPKSSESKIAMVSRSNKTLPTCKGEEISLLEENLHINNMSMNDSININDDQMLIFSWKSEKDLEKQNNNVFGDRSYTMLHWSNSSYTTAPKHVLADVLKRVISSVSNFNLQSKSLCSFQSPQIFCNSKSQTKSEISFKEDMSRSSQTATRIQNESSEHKCKIQRQNDCNKPCEQRNRETNGNIKKIKSCNNKLPSYRRQFSTNLKKENIVSYTHDLETNYNRKKENTNIADKSYSLPFARKDIFAADLTSGELNMYINYPLLPKPHIYSWWNQHQKFSKKRTVQKLLETSSTYTISSEEEECDVISWRD